MTVLVTSTGCSELACVRPRIVLDGLSWTGFLILLNNWALQRCVSTVSSLRGFRKSFVMGCPRFQRHFVKVFFGTGGQLQIWLEDYNETDPMSQRSAVTTPTPATTAALAKAWSRVAMGTPRRNARSRYTAS